MVASENEEVLWVLDLVGQEEADGFQTLLSTIYVVAKEQIVGGGRETAVLEETKEVIVLTVDIAYVGGARVSTRASKQTSKQQAPQRNSPRTANLDGRLKLEQDRLANENLASLHAKLPNLRLEQLHLLAGSASAHIEQARDDLKKSA